MHRPCLGPGKDVMPVEARAGHHSTKGGSSETLEKLFTVIPTGPASPWP